MQGWIKLHRKIQENPLWKNGRVFSKAEAWLDILMEVQHSKKEDKTMIGNAVITCNRGQSIKSIQTWAERWKWSRSAVQRFFQWLKREKMITTENLVKTIRITVCNYKTYQQDRIGSESEVNRTRIGSESVPDTDKNGKNDKNGKKVKKTTAIIPENLNTPDFLKAWTNWNQFRKELKKKLTPSTITSQLKKLSNYPVSTAIEAIEKSIEKGWTGLFPETKEEYERKTVPTGQQKHLDFGAQESKLGFTASNEG